MADPRARGLERAREVADPHAEEGLSEAEAALARREAGTWHANVAISQPYVRPDADTRDLGGFVFTPDRGIEVGMGFADGDLQDPLRALREGA